VRVASLLRRVCQQPVRGKTGSRQRCSAQEQRCFVGALKLRGRPGRNAGDFYRRSPRLPWRRVADAGDHASSRATPETAKGFLACRWPQRAAATCLCSLFSLGLLLVTAGRSQLRAEAPAYPQYPLAVAAGSDGSLLVADRLLPGVWKLAVGGPPTVLLKASQRFDSPLAAVRTVAVAGDGTVLVGCSATREIYRVAPDGSLKMLTDGGIGIPIDIAVHPDGHCFVSDLETQQVWKLPLDGGRPVPYTRLAAPRGLDVDAAGQLWCIAASSEQPLVRITAAGRIEPVVTSRAFSFPHDVVVDPAGIAYVSDSYAGRIWRVGPDGSVTEFAGGSPLVGPVGLARQGDSLIVADPRSCGLYTIDAAGSVTVHPAWQFPKR